MNTSHSTAKVLDPDDLNSRDRIPDGPLPKVPSQSKDVKSTDVKRTEVKPLTILDSDACLKEGQAHFEKDPNAILGGRIYHQEHDQAVHTSGTRRDGTYIAPDGYIRGGVRQGTASKIPDVYLKSTEEIMTILQLEIKDKDKGIFTRRGFSGHYQLQKEMDGSYSVFYTGGIHRNSGNIKTVQAQTFRHGVWDVDRKVPVNEITAQRDARRSKNLEEVSRIGKEILSRTDKDGYNHTPIGFDYRGGSGFYSNHGAMSRHAPSGSKESFKRNDQLAIKDIDILIPSGSSRERVLERRDLSPAVKVSREVDGVKHEGFAFARIVGVQKGVMYLDANDPDIPREVRSAYQNAVTEDGSLHLHVWKRNEAGDTKTMVRSDGSVLFDRGSENGEISLSYPDLRETGIDRILWRELQLRKGDERLGEVDYVETDDSKVKRRELDNSRTTKTKDHENEVNFIRNTVENHIKENPDSGFHIIEGLALPEDHGKRNSLIKPFTVKTGFTRQYVFPRNFRDRSSNQEVSGLLVIGDKEIKAISKLDSTAYDTAKIVYDSLSTKGVEKWFRIESGKPAEANIRPDGSFLLRENATSDIAVIYSVTKSPEGDIRWKKASAYKEADQRYYPSKEKDELRKLNTPYYHGTDRDAPPSIELPQSTWSKIKSWPGKAYDKIKYLFS